MSPSLTRFAISIAALAGCANHPSALDSPPEPAGAGDPWAVATPTDSDDGPSTSESTKPSPLSLDMLSKVGEAIKKRGPYEAPTESQPPPGDAPHFAIVELSGAVVERTAFSLSPFGQRGGRELRDLIARFDEIAHDDKLTGVIIRLGELAISLPDAVELRAAMHGLRALGKRLACHTESASNTGYLVIAACDRIGLAPLGMIAIAGPSAMPIHVKPLLDKLGVQADFLHVGAYKGAAEPLTRDAPSREMRETIDAILDRHHATLVDIIARDRKLAPAVVGGLIDDALHPSERALAAKLVDEVSSFEAFRDRVVGTTGWRTRSLNDDSDQAGLAALTKLARFVGMMPPARPTGDHVAVVYALGSIVDGGGDGVLGARQEIASHTTVAALRALASDDAVKAVVLRIDSGGGSAQASELIWRAVSELKARKPVVVSMSDVAASGGYYIASGATKIFAQPDTLTGSIGVVGGKIAPGPALARLGVMAYPMGRGKRATIMGSLEPWTVEERAIIQRTMEEVYDVFTKRVAGGRKLELAKVQELAQGRVWTGAKAKELGLVDELGGLTEAVAEARRLGGVAVDRELEVFPSAPTLRDVLAGWGAVEAPTFGSGLEGVLATVEPTIATVARDLVELARSFSHTHIQTVAVLPVVR